VGSEARKLTEDHPERDEGEQRQEAPRPPPRHPRRISPRAMPTRGADRCRRGVLRRASAPARAAGSRRSLLFPPAEKSRRLRGSEVVEAIASRSALESVDCWSVGVPSRVFTVSQVVTNVRFGTNVMSTTFSAEKQTWLLLTPNFDKLVVL